MRADFIIPQQVNIESNIPIPQRGEGKSRSAEWRMAIRGMAVGDSFLWTGRYQEVSVISLAFKQNGWRCSYRKLKTIKRKNCYEFHIRIWRIS